MDDLLARLTKRLTSKWHPFTDRREIEHRPERPLDHWNGRDPLPKFLDSLFQTLRRLRFLSPQEEHALAVRWREHGDITAREKLILCHLPLVARIARRSVKQMAIRKRDDPGRVWFWMLFQDRFSAGAEALIHAVDQFNPKRSRRLSAYAGPRIKGAIYRYIQGTRSLVKIGTNERQRKTYAQLHAAKWKLYNETGTGNLYSGSLYQDQAEILAGWLDVSAQEVLAMDARMRGDCSLDAFMRRGETFEDVTDADNEQRQSHINFEEFRRIERLDDDLHDAAIVKALAKLNEIERHVFEARRLCDPSISRQKLADELDITRYRVTEIEARALAKVRQALKPTPKPAAYDDRCVALAREILGLNPCRGDFDRRHGEISMALAQHAWVTRPNFNVIATLAKRFRDSKDPSLIHERNQIAKSLRHVT